MVFLSPRANVELAPKIHVALHASHAALPSTKFEILVKTQSSKRDENFVPLRPSQHKTQPKNQLLSSAAPSQQSTSHTLTFFTSHCCTLLTYLLTPWSRVLLEKLTGLQLVKKFPAFYGTRWFITALTSVRHLSLSWASPIESPYPHPTSWRSILISTHLCLGLPSGLFPSGFPTKTLYAPLSSPIRVTCPAPLILLDFITRTILGEEYRSFSSSLCSLLHSPVTSSLLGPNLATWWKF